MAVRSTGAAGDRELPLIPEFAAFIAEETDRWAAVVHKLGITAD